MSQRDEVKPKRWQLKSPHFCWKIWRTGCTLQMRGQYDGQPSRSLSIWSRMPPTQCWTQSMSDKPCGFKALSSEDFFFSITDPVLICPIHPAILFFPLADGHIVHIFHGWPFMHKRSTLESQTFLKKLQNNTADVLSHYLPCTSVILEKFF